jgi:hypothetical protein
MSRPFVILGTPRSRTAWLAEFLTHGSRSCAHEPSRNWSGLSDLHAALDGGQGISDSVLTLRWRNILIYAPDTALVVIHRDAEEVLASFRRAGLWHPRLPALVNSIEHAIDDLADDVPAAIHVPYGALSRRDVCGRIWAHCRGDVMLVPRWEEYRDKIVVADAAQHIADTMRNAAGVVALYPEFARLAA